MWVGIAWIVAVEFRVGADAAALTWFDKALQLIEVVDTPYSDTVLTEHIVAIRRGRRCKLPDAIILALAQVRSTVLITRDRQLLAMAEEINAAVATWRVG